MMTIWVIYAHPTDYPDKFVMREHTIENGKVTPTDYFRIANTLAQIRRFIPEGAQRVERQEDDEPQIFEWWFGKPEDEPEPSG
jgi:hypothetical protein